MKRDNTKLYGRARKMYGSWNNLMKAAGYPVRFYQKINKFEFNEDFAYFLGLIVTDGHLVCKDDSKRYQLAIYTSYPKEKKMIFKLIKDLFDYKPGVSSRMYGYSKKPSYEIRIMSKVLIKYLTDEIQIPSGSKSLNLEVPEIINKSDVQIKKAFLRGVLDGDGSVLKRSIKFTSGSIDFLKGIKDFLKQLDITPGSIIKENRSGSAMSIRIYKYQDLIKMKELYNGKYYYPRKKRRIDKI